MNNAIFLGIGWLVCSLCISPMFIPLTLGWIIYFVIFPLALIIVGLDQFRRETRLQ